MGMQQWAIQAAITTLATAPLPAYLSNNKYMDMIIRAAADAVRVWNMPAGPMKNTAVANLAKAVDNITATYRKDIDTIDQKIRAGAYVEAAFANLALVKNRAEFYMRDGKAASDWSSVSDSSILVTFNEMTARYLSGLSEVSQNHRIHLPLIDALANGNSSNEVMQGHAIKDVNFDPEYLDQMMSGNKGLKYDPPEGSVMFASLARAIRSAAVTKDDKGRNMFLFDNYQDVPGYLRESMRTNLPVFDKEFDMLMRKAELIKQMLDEGKVNIARHVSKNYEKQANWAKGAAELVPQDDVHAGLRMVQTETDADRKGYIRNMLGGIVAASQNIVRCSTTAQKELNDVPQYLELYDGSIRDFRDRNRALPFMPLSSLSFLVNPNGVSRDIRQNDNNWLNPCFTTGTPQFKMMYGTRLLLAKNRVDPKIEYMPGMKVLSEKFNQVSDKIGQMSSGTTSALFTDTVLAYRFVTDIMYHKRVVGGSVGGGSTDHRVTFNAPPLAPFQHQAPLEDVISLTESNDLRNSMLRVADFVSPTSGVRGADRAGTRIMNIVDANIVPLHVHSMCREVPLINIYNYAYTFDRMVHEMLAPEFGSKKSFVPDELEHAGSTAEMMAKVLIHPYGQYNTKEHFDYQARLAAGDDNFNMARPKYISDQLHGKVLLGDLYPFSGPGDGDFPVSDASPASEIARKQGVLFSKDRGRLPFVGSRKLTSKPNPMNKYLSYVPSAKGFGARTKVEFAEMPSKRSVEDLARLGKVRSDTRIVRTLSWVTSMQRFTRLVIKSQLQWIDTPVVQGIQVLSEKVTEYPAEASAYNPADF